MIIKLDVNQSANKCIVVVVVVAVKRIYALLYSFLYTQNVCP